MTITPPPAPSQAVETLTGAQLAALGITTSRDQWPQDYRPHEYDVENDAPMYWSVSGDEVDGTLPVEDVLDLT